MIIENSKIINDLVTFCPKSFKDNRGYFSEIYQKNIYKKELKIDFVQDNTSFSKKNTIRGFHFQTNKPQGKLIFCLRGSFDLYIVDLRKKSKSYLKIIVCKFTYLRVVQMLFFLNLKKIFYYINVLSIGVPSLKKVLIFLTIILSI